MQGRKQTINEEKTPSGLVPVKEDAVDSCKALKKKDKEDHVALTLFNAILHGQGNESVSRERNLFWGHIEGSQ